MKCRITYTHTRMNRRRHISASFCLCVLLLLTLRMDAQSNRVAFERVGGVVEVHCIYQDSRGFMWFGRLDGLARYDGYDFVVYQHDPRNPKSIADNSVWALGEDKFGVLWVGTGNGLDRFDRATGTFTHFRHDSTNPRTMRSNGPNVIHLDRKGNLWIGSWGGLSRFNYATEIFTHYQHDSLNPRTLTNNVVNGIVEESTPTGNIFWVATGNFMTGEGGMNEFDPATGIVKRFKHIPGDPRSLALDNVNTVILDHSGRLLVGSNGLQTLDRATGIFTGYPVKGNRLRPSDSDYVKVILEDRTGDLWIGTWGNGLLTYDPASEKLESYAHDPANRKSLSRNMIFTVFEDKEGTIWIGSLGAGGGLSKVVRAKSPGDIKSGPPVAIVGFKKFDVPVSLDSTVSEKKAIELSHSENVFSFDFASLSYTNPEKNQYAYKLEGYDKEWVYCGTQRYARYARIKPGKYLFKVKGCNANGTWNGEGASIALIISPPFWQTTWFTVVFWVTIAGSAGGTIRYVQVRKLKKRIAQLERERAVERERVRISQNINDEVGAGLTEITILSELLKKKMENPEGAKAQIDQISDRAAEVIDNIGEIIWAINPKNDSLDNLIPHMRHHAVKYLGLATIGCKFVAPETLPRYNLSAEARHNLFLIVKEALHNVVKHSQASEVELIVSLEDGKAQIQIKDNGKGFLLDERMGSGNGLVNMRKRIEDIGGAFRIESEPALGTTVALTINMTLPT